MLTKNDLKFDVYFWRGVYRAVRRRGNGALASFYWTFALWWNQL